MKKGFSCKQFSVAQAHCAMKVGTDSLILGSWAEVSHGKRILDIGTGTGILALMMAQKTDQSSSVMALELDPSAVFQAKQNVLTSPWPEKITVIRDDIRFFHNDSAFDVIICNPPYFTAARKATKAYEKQLKNRKEARHDNGLQPMELIAKAAELLTETGRFFCMYPFDRKKEILLNAAEAGLTATACLRVKSLPEQQPYLCLFCFVHDTCQLPGIPTQKLLTIRDECQSYTSEFKILCRDFYLNF